MSKKNGLLQLTAVELMAIPATNRKRLIQAAAVEAIQQSFLGNTTPANLLIKMLPEVGQRSPGARKSLIEYLVKWGNLRYSEQVGKFKFVGLLRPEEWTNSYEATVSKHRWDGTIEESSPKTQPIVDAEVEIRKVIDRLEKIKDDPEREVVHPFLINKIRAILFEYGTSSKYEPEVKRGRTLFDESTKRQTMRASKHAK